MKQARVYGEAPRRVVLVHGGPGAAGEMGPVARELGKKRGVLEALQTRTNVSGQVEELSLLIGKYAEAPVTVVGFSWGAWIGVVLAARQYRLVKNLVLVGCPPFEEHQARGIEQTRLDRLGGDTAREYMRLGTRLAVGGDKRAMARFGALSTQADAYEPLEEPPEPVEFRPQVFAQAWADGAKLRNKGGLLALCRHVRCPVCAIHGDYDPHPARGVEGPLSVHLKEFRFVLLEKCGHKPWIERHARDAFYEALERELPEL